MEWMEIREVVQDDNRVLVGLAFIFLAVCLLNTIGLLLAKFIGKSPVVGLRRALGASKAMIFRQHLVEVGIIGIVGGIETHALKNDNVVDIHSGWPRHKFYAFINYERCVDYNG